jgi:GNAT superfamily N-acetyltransferase
VNDVTIVAGYRPGLIGQVTALHASYYHASWGFGLPFEVKVATELATFLSRFAPGRDGIWLALQDDAVVGSVAIDASEAEGRGARLRWLILAPAAQGRGVGGRLLTTALAHTDGLGFPQVYLTTFAGLDAARALYERAGFQLTHAQLDTTWGIPVREQTFERLRPPAAFDLSPTSA